MKNIDNISFLNERRGKIITNKGGWEIGKGVTSHGYSLLDDLAKNARFFQVVVLNITGRLPEKRLAQWLESIFICLSWPDPRIWCNQMGSFAGSLKASPIAGVCAGIMASDSSLYGPGTMITATRFIVNAHQFVKNNGTIAEYINQNAKTRLGLKAPGYARPIAKGDERVDVMSDIARTLGFDNGNYIKTAYDIEEYLIKNYDESMNLTGYIVAFLSDQGFTDTEIYRITSLCVNGGIHACYSEANDSLSDSFLPLHCDDIEYIGVPPRSLNSQKQN